MRPLWALLVATLVLLVVLAVGGATSIFYVHFPQRLDAELQREFEGDVERMRAELAAQDATLDALLDKATQRALEGTAATQAAPWFWAKELLPARGAQLKVLSSSGRVLSSGHWPASIGAIDPATVEYRASKSGSAIIQEPLPFGSILGLQRWREGSWGGRPAIFVAGLEVGPEALELLRVQQRLDLLVLEDRSSGLRVTAAAPDLEFSTEFGAAGHEGEGALLLRSHRLPVPKTEALLLVGRGRGSIVAAQRGVRRVLVLVGGGSSLLALLLGLLLARKLASPVEALAETAGRLAKGDLGARVEPGASNVAEVERLVAAFNQMADDIQQSQTQLVQAERVAAWREIARGLAHELKNPLTPILGAMDVIRKARALDRDDFDEILDEQARALVAEVVRLKELADEFARFARLPERRPEPVDIPELLDGAVALYSSAFDTLSVVRHYDDTTPVIYADRNQLQTVITNLVKNALDAMGGAGTLALSVDPAELANGSPGVCLRVGDSGPGIPEEVRDKLFTPYFTTKGSRGTGLGLALTHRIVLEHGGTITVGSASEGGAEFSLRLPVGSPSAPLESSESNSQPAPPHNS